MSTSTVDSNDLKTISVLPTEVLDQKLSLGSKTKQKRSQPDSSDSAIEKLEDQDDRFPLTGNSPLEDGEIEDEESDDAFDQSSQTSVIKDNHNTENNVMVTSLKRALHIGDHSDGETKGRRLSSNDDSNKFQRVVSNRNNTKYLKKSIGKNQSSKCGNRTDKNCSIPTSINDRHWNSTSTKKPSDLTADDIIDTSELTKQRQQRSSTSFRNNTRNNNRKLTPVCRFFIESRCNKGSECPFSHDAQPLKRYELCKFYLNGFCVKHDHCNFMHNDFPCKFFHGPSNKCNSPSGECRFSHDLITDPRVKAAFEKILNESNHDDQSANQSTLEVENDLTDHSNPNHHKPSLLGSPPKQVSITEPTQPSHQLKRFGGSTSVGNYQYYKESILTNQSTCIEASSSNPPVYTGDDVYHCGQQLHMIHPSPSMHHRLFHPTPPLQPQQIREKIMNDRYNHDSRSGQPLQRFANQWQMPGCPIMHPHTFNPRNCAPDIIRMQPPPPPLPPPMYACSHRIPANLSNIHINPNPAKLISPSQSRIRLAPNIPHPHNYTNNDLMTSCNWMNNVQPHPIRYNYQTWPNHPLHQNQEVRIRAPLTKASIVTNTDHSKIGPNCDFTNINKFQTLQELINAVNRDPHINTDVADTNESCNLSTKLEELLNLLQNNKDDNIKNIGSDNRLSSDNDDLTKHSTVHIQAKTDLFRYRLYKIDHSINNKHQYTYLNSDSGNAVKFSSNSINEACAKDPRLMRQTRSSLKDPRITNVNRITIETTAINNNPDTSCTFSQLSVTTSANSMPTVINATTAVDLKSQFSRLSDPRLTKLMQQYSTISTSSKMA